MLLLDRAKALCHRNEELPHATATKNRPVPPQRGDALATATVGAHLRPHRRWHRPLGLSCRWHRPLGLSSIQKTKRDDIRTRAIATCCASMLRPSIGSYTAVRERACGGAGCWALECEPGTANEHPRTTAPRTQNRLIVRCQATLWASDDARSVIATAR